MPIFEYKCPICGEIYTSYCFSLAGDEVYCHVCGVKCEKQISVPGKPIIK